MLYKKRISALDALYLDGFAHNNWDKLGELVRYIIDNDKGNAFDFYIANEFPHGIEDLEFQELCLNHQDEIRANI